MLNLAISSIKSHLNEIQDCGSRCRLWGGGGANICLRETDTIALGGW